jgi:cell division protein FtsL
MTTLHKLCCALLLLLMLTAMAVVHTQHRARKLTADLNRAKLVSRDLDTRHRELQVEQAKWVTAAQVQARATNELGMKLIDPASSKTIEAAR